MTDLRGAGSAGSFSCLCSACEPSSAMSRRQFLCTGTAGAITAASVAGAIGASSGAARAQQPALGRPILIKGGCVLTLDRAIGAPTCWSRARRFRRCAPISPPVYPTLAAERPKGYRVGKGALLRAVPPAPYPPPQTGEGSEGVVGTLRFAQPTTLPYDRKAL